MPTANAGLALLGLLLLVLAIVLLRRLKDPKKRDRLLGVLFAPKEARKSAGAEEKTLEYRVAYTDVIRGAQGDAPMLPADYADLTKRLAACPSDRERIRLAYRMMVACLVSRNLGVSLSDTPREIAESLVSRGIGSDAAELYIKTDTGDVVGSLLSDKTFLVETDTGRREDPKTTTGGRCEIKTDTGDVEGSLLSEKIFFPESDTGKIDVPKTTSGGKCEINTDTGNIKIRIN